MPTPKIITKAEFCETLNEAFSHAKNLAVLNNCTVKLIFKNRFYYINAKTKFKEL